MNNLPVLSDLRTSVPWIFSPVDVRGNATPELDSSKGFYNGVPNDEDFARLRSHLGPMQGIDEFTKDDWIVVTCNACDNSLDSDRQSFSPSVLKQYADRANGRSFLINHAIRDVESNKGLIIDSGLYRAAEFPSWLRESVPNAGAADSLAKAHGGYLWIMLKIAVRANTESAQAIASRSIDRLSVGFYPYDERYYCPECTYSRGQNTGFYDQEVIITESKGQTSAETRNICPHVSPNWWNILMASWDCLGDDDDPIQWSMGEIVDCDVLPFEISAVNQGAFGAARIIRRVAGVGGGAIA